ncbi:competence protein CoiA family protein [[Kitasatospora] papulosa]|uniref:competence protein CoiA family protein n=1 Tax=[Kitasatospora] papulosa TaxID=1464011 RepID=UPI0036429C89
MGTSRWRGLVASGPRRPQAFTQDTAQVLAVDKKIKQLRYLPGGQGNGEMEPGVTWRGHVAQGMLLCPAPDCGLPFGRVVAGGARRHHFAHRPGEGEHDAVTGPETLWHLSAKDVLGLWAASHPNLADWTLHLDDTPITLPNGWRRPDVLAVSPDGAQVAFEVQYSALTGTDWKTRHDFYAKAGVVDIWLFAHHGPQWRPATPRQRRRRELVWRDADWAAPVQLSGLHQTMLRHGVVPLWLDPTAQMIGTATTRAHPANTSPVERLWEGSSYTLPPRRTYPACHVAADALQQCEVDLEAGELLTPARREQREEHQRLTVDEQAVKDRAARREERLQAEWDQHKRQEQERRDAEIAAAEAREQIPLREQFPPLFRPQEPPPAVKPPWWKPWQHRA